MSRFQANIYLLSHFCGEGNVWVMLLWLFFFNCRLGQRGRTFIMSSSSCSIWKHMHFKFSIPPSYFNNGCSTQPWLLEVLERHLIAIAMTSYYAIRTSSMEPLIQEEFEAWYIGRFSWWQMLRFVFCFVNNRRIIYNMYWKCGERG